MLLVDPPDLPALAPLFAANRHTFTWTCLQGHMGKAWADRLPNPTCARILTGDVALFAGDSRSPDAGRMVRALPASYTTPFCIMIPPAPDWAALIEAAHPGRFQRSLRHALRHDWGFFDPERLRACIARLPEGLELAPLGREHHACVLREPWSADFCSQFTSWEDYALRGIGFLVLDNGRPVCGASSYTVFDDGIEIEIATVPGYRRRGLAAACAARLILACRERGIFPGWDAANPESLALALKLGYRHECDYPVHLVDLDQG